MIKSHHPGLVTRCGNVTSTELMIMIGRLVMRPLVLQLIPYILLMLCTMNNIKVIVNLKRDYLVDGEADPNGPLKSKGWHKKSKR